MVGQEQKALSTTVQRNERGCMKQCLACTTKHSFPPVTTTYHKPLRFRHNCMQKHRCVYTHGYYTNYCYYKHTMSARYTPHLEYIQTLCHWTVKFAVLSQQQLTLWTACIQMLLVRRETWPADGDTLLHPADKRRSCAVIHTMKWHKHHNTHYMIEMLIQWSLYIVAIYCIRQSPPKARSLPQLAPHHTHC